MAMRIVKGRVTDTPSGAPIRNAKVELKPKTGKAVVTTFAGPDGVFSAELDDSMEWTAQAHAYGACSDPPRPVVPDCGELLLTIGASARFQPVIRSMKDCAEPVPCQYPVAHQPYEFYFESSDDVHSIRVEGAGLHAHALNAQGTSHEISAAAAGEVEIGWTLTGPDWSNPAGGGGAKIPGPQLSLSRAFAFRGGQGPGVARVALQRSSVRPTAEEDLWTLIRANSRAIGFNAYKRFIDRVLCAGQDPGANFPTFAADGERLVRERRELTANFGVGAYELLRTATELFLLLNCRVDTSRKLGRTELIEERARRSTFTPRDLGDLARQFLGNNAYLEHVIEAAFPGLDPGGNFCDGVLVRTEPVLIELMWSYWQEEGMLVQSVNALARRFQNMRAPGGRDPLAHFELEPLRPLNNILWGYVQEEYRRLTVPRRALEYSHHYGLTLFGKAVSGARPADPRSKFLESFHNLLHRCSQFYKEDNDTTVIADGFPLLNALKEVHLTLAHGAHNQFGDLPWTARVEMLMQQWIMARTETRDFLQSRAMVPYTEPWMAQVEVMKLTQGWTDVPASQFHDLATYGEQLLLSIRYGDWIDINDEDVAKNWARYFRPEVQSYLHSYRAAAGVDLTNPDSVDYTIPAVHLQRRLGEQARAR